MTATTTTVWLVRYEHKHGDDVEAYATEALAWEAAFSIVVREIDAEIGDPDQRASVQSYIDAHQHKEAVAEYLGFVNDEDITVTAHPIHSEVRA